MTELPAPQFSEKVDTEFGLRLPDGTEVWPPQLFMDTARYQEPDERAVIHTALVNSVQNMHLPEEELDRYCWLVRYKRTMTTVVYHERVGEVPMSETELANPEGGAGAPDDAHSCDGKMCADGCPDHS